MPDHPRTPLPPATPRPGPRTLGEAVIAQWRDAACANDVGKLPEPTGCCRDRSRATDDRLTRMGDPLSHMDGVPADDRPAVLRVTLDEGATLPVRQHEQDAGLDLFPLANTLPRLMPHETRVFDTGVHVEIPAGYVGIIATRSSMARRSIEVGGGIIDSPYRGPLGVVLTNGGQAQWVAQPGAAIAQLLVVPCLLLSPMVVDSLGETARGAKGFGSSDKEISR